MSEGGDHSFRKNDTSPDPNPNDMIQCEDSFSQSSLTNDPMRNSNKTLKPETPYKGTSGPPSDNETFTTAVSSSPSGSTSSDEKYLRDSRSHAVFVELSDLPTARDSMMHSVYEDADNSISTHSDEIQAVASADKESLKSIAKLSDTNGTSSTSGISDVSTMDITNTRLVDSPSAFGLGESPTFRTNQGATQRRSNTNINRSASLIVPQKGNSDQLENYRFNVGNSSLSSDSNTSIIDVHHLPIEGLNNKSASSSEAVTSSNKKTKTLAEKPFEKRPFHLSQISDGATSGSAKTASPRLTSIHNTMGALLLSGQGNGSPTKKLPESKGKLVPHFRDMADKLEAQKAQRDHAVATNNMIRSMSLQSKKQSSSNYLDPIETTKMKLSGEGTTSEGKNAKNSTKSTRKFDEVPIEKKEKNNFDIEKGQKDKYHDEWCPTSIAIIMILLSLLAPPFWILISTGYTDHAFGKVEWKYKVTSAVLALIFCIGAIIGIAVGLGYGLTH